MTAVPAVAVSVVVTVRNEAANLPDLMEALRNQTLPRHLYEIVVVDDASTDGSAAIARRAGARVLQTVDHVGLPRGRNLGIRSAVGDLLAFTDGDCLPASDWLERGLAAFEESGADIVAGSIIVPVDGQSPVAALVDAATFFDQKTFVKRGFGAGANLWVRRSVVEEHGGFDERLGMYGDEEELCQRAVASGARLTYADDVHVAHRPRRTARDVARKAFLLGYCLARHREHTSGPLAAHPRIFLQPRAYLPNRRIYGLDRVTRQVRPSARKLVAMWAFQYCIVSIPRLLGDAAGELKRAIRNRRSTDGAHSWDVRRGGPYRDLRP